MATSSDALSGVDLRSVARALGGDVVGRQVVAPGPGHSTKDRSLSVTISATAPDGFLAFSHASDDFASCRDHVKLALGLPTHRPSRPTGTPRALRAPQPRRDAGDSAATRTSDALKVWSEGVDPRGTLTEIYLAGRGLDLGEEIAGDVVRWHRRTKAMLALFRDIRTDEPRAVSRTFIDDAALKIGRKFIGPVRGCAVKLDADEEVTHGLHISEGVETAMAARQIGLRPAWGLGSAGAIAAFPVLTGIEALSLLREHDEASLLAISISRFAGWRRNADRVMPCSSAAWWIPRPRGLRIRLSRRQIIARS
jgi:putative DNA primase/helicase